MATCRYEGLEGVKLLVVQPLDEGRKPEGRPQVAADARDPARTVLDRRPPRRGGMGEVYRARDTRLGRDVAVKVLSADVSGRPEARARFESEAKTVSRLSHPHICALYDVGREGPPSTPRSPRRA